MSLPLKLTSLFVKTLSKPIANYIKRNAREHERFRSLCVRFAQRVHVLDMRLRLGLIRDPAKTEAKIVKEVLEAENKRRLSGPPTVKTEEETLLDQQREKKEIRERTKAANLPRIRPLSESKAIETGANFISETFMFMVAGSVIVFESWRSYRKEALRREDVAERIASVEEAYSRMTTKIQELEATLAANPTTALPDPSEDPKRSQDAKMPQSPTSTTLPPHLSRPLT